MSDMELIWDEDVEKVMLTKERYEELLGDYKNSHDIKWLDEDGEIVMWAKENKGLDGSSTPFSRIRAGSVIFDIHKNSALKLADIIKKEIRGVGW